MNILIACEESQRVCTAFREKGHDAFSCDLLPCSGGHPEWHINGDVLKILNGKTDEVLVFVTQDGMIHDLPDRWDLIIAHPPCTYLTVTGNRWYDVSLYGEKAIKRFEERENAIKFFMCFVNADCDKIAIENPVGIMSTFYKKPTQYIQPYMFGDRARKKTGLWLKNLPNLQPTNIVDCGELDGNGMSIGASAAFAIDENGKRLSWSDPKTAIIRSRTFFGIAKAMSEQWG